MKLVTVKVHTAVQLWRVGAPLGNPRATAGGPRVSRRARTGTGGLNRGRRRPYVMPVREGQPRATGEAWTATAI